MKSIIKRKKILIGCIITATILLLMPSIPAIQNKIVMDEIKEGFNIKNIRELLDNGNLDRKKHLLLLIFVYLIAGFRLKRIDILCTISIKNVEYVGRIPIIELRYPIIYLRAVMLIFTTIFWFYNWQKISDKYVWNWDILYLPG